MVLQNWFLNQKHQHHLSLLEGPTLDPSPDLLDQTLWGRCPAFCVLMHLPDGSRAHAGTRLPLHTHCFLLQAPESSFRCVQTTDVQRPQATHVGQSGSAGDLVSWDQLPTSDRQDLENKNTASSNVRWASLSHVLPGFSEVPIRTEPRLPQLHLLIYAPVLTPFLYPVSLPEPHASWTTS